MPGDRRGDDDRGAARDPGAGGAVRELDPADGDRADRADVRAGGAVRRLDLALPAVHAAGRPQHLHPGGAGGAGRPGLQERDPDRRVRQGARGARRGAARRGDRGLPDAAAADPDDLDRLLRRRPAADLRQRRGQRDAPGDGHRGVLGHARRDPVRHLPDAGVLRAAARSAGAAPAGADRRRARPRRRWPGRRPWPRRRRETAMREPRLRPGVRLAGRGDRDPRRRRLHGRPELPGAGGSARSGLRQRDRRPTPRRPAPTSPPSGTASATRGCRCWSSGRSPPTATSASPRRGCRRRGRRCRAPTPSGCPRSASPPPPPAR